MFHLSLITPGGKIFDADIEYLRAPGTEGSLGILSRHTAMLTLTKKDVLMVRHDNKEAYFATGPGILEVGPDHSVLLLADEALPAKDTEEAHEKLKALKR